jgi:hypothetical protein
MQWPKAETLTSGVMEHPLSPFGALATGEGGGEAQGGKPPALNVERLNVQRLNIESLNIEIMNIE